MTHLRAYILDGDAPASRRLRKLLAAEPGIEVVEEGDGLVAATNRLKEAAADLVFLDPNTVAADPFAIVEAAELAEPPLLVLVTDSAAHAIEAFDRGAVDYLLKPVRLPRLRQALERARQLRGGRATGSSSQVLGPRQVRFVVRTDRQLAVVPVEQVDWMAAAGNYIVLHVGRTSHILRESLTGLESRLDPARFARVSRSAMVNLDRVVSVTTADAGEPAVRLVTGDSIPLTRGVRELQARLELGAAAGSRTTG